MNWNKTLMGSMTVVMIVAIVAGAYFLKQMATELDETKTQLAKVESTANAAVVNAGKASAGASDALQLAKHVDTTTSDVFLKTEAVEKKATDALLIAKAGKKNAKDAHDLAASLKSGVGTLQKDVASRSAFSVESGELRFDSATFKIFASRDAVQDSIPINDALRKSIGDSADGDAGIDAGHHVVKISAWADAVIDTEGDQNQGQAQRNRGITVTVKLKKPARQIVHAGASLQGFEFGSGSKMHLESSVTNIGNGKFDIRVWTSADADGEIHAVRVKWVAITAASVGD